MASVDWIDDENLIKITHFVNPHMFWFKYEATFFTNEKFFQLHRNIEEYYFQQEKSMRQCTYKPQIGEIVGVYYFSWNRWLRAEVDSIFESSSKRYIVWAVDYGVPLEIEERFIRKLPGSLANVEINAVYFGGIADIVPAEKIYDFKISSTKIVKCKKWSSYSSEMLTDLINDAAYVRFIKKKNDPINSQIFGDLEIITHTNHVYKPATALLESNHAIRVESDDVFFKILKNIGTTKGSRWETDGGRPHYYKSFPKFLLNSEIKSNDVLEDEEINKVDIKQKIFDWEERNVRSYANNMVPSNQSDEIEIKTVETVSTMESGNKERKVNSCDLQNRNLKDQVGENESRDNKDHNVNDEQYCEEVCVMNVAGLTRSKRVEACKSQVALPPSKDYLANKNEEQNNITTTKKSLDETENNKLAVQQKLDLMKQNRMLIQQKLSKEVNDSNRKNELLKKTQKQGELKNEIQLNQSGNSTEKSTKSLTNDKSFIDSSNIKSSSSIVDQINVPTVHAVPAECKSNNLLQKSKAIENRISMKKNQRKLFLERSNLNLNLSENDKSNETSSNTSISNIKSSSSVVNEINIPTENVVPAKCKSNNLLQKSKATENRIAMKKNQRKLFLERTYLNEDDKSGDTLINTSISMKSSLSEKVDFENKNIQQNLIPVGVDLTNLLQNKRKPEANQKVLKFIADVNMNMQNSVARKQKSNESSGYHHFQECPETCVVDNNQSKHLVLVHGRQAKPIEKFENANFCEDVHRELENMRFTKIYRIQSYTWPHLMRGNSVVVINGARTGKTISYLPAICSLIKMKKDENAVPDGKGPVGVIIVPNSVDVEKIRRICNRLFQMSENKLSIVELFGIRRTQSATLQLLNGCDILVTTVPSLTRILSEEIKYFDLNRLQHLVIDNIDLIHGNVQSDLSTILKKFRLSNINLFDANEQPVQMVITARLWHNYIYQLLKICNNPQLCIGAYIEAAVYAKSQFKMKFITNKSKIQAIIDFIKEHPYSDERLIILCNSDDDSEEVVEALQSISCLVTYANSRSSAHEIQLALEWHKKKNEFMSILVCTDSVLYESKTQNAQNLIHYSLPDSWSKFTFRFSVFLEYYEDLIKIKEPSKPSTTSLILLDETNNSQLPKLIEFLHNHGRDKDISQEILNLANQIVIQKEEKRIQSNREFCSEFMSFGECSNQSDCKYRHTLTKHDAPNKDIPTEGIIIVKVLHILSPAHYCVRILGQQTKNGNIKSASDSQTYANFFLEFALYFNNEDNHKFHWPIHVNDLCVVKDNDTYYRAKILDVPTKSQNLTQITVDVKLIDIGRIMKFKSTSILYLPEKFQEYPFQAINLRISGIVPYDYEHEWDSEATYTVQNWFDSYGKKVGNEVVVKASVLFSIMDTIWVDKIVIQENLKPISCAVYGINIKKELLEKHFAKSFNHAADVLREKAISCGLLQTKSKNPNIKETSENSKTIQGPLSSSTIVDTFAKNNFNPKDTNSTDSVYNTLATSKQPQKVLSSVSSSESTSRNMDKLNRSRARARQTRNEADVELSQVPSVTRNYVRERWEVLNEDDFTRIVVSMFYTPNHFYVQNVDEINRLEELYAMINKYIETNPSNRVTEPNVDMNCIAKLHDQYNRAKITKVLCTADELKVNLFFCDSGEYSIKPLQEVYHSSEEIITFMPFQAIRCKLFGIQPVSNGIWNEDICDLMYDCVIELCEFLYVKPKRIIDRSSENGLKYCRYEVLMVDCSTAVDTVINHKVVLEGMALYDPETEHLIDVNFSKEEKEEDDESDSVYGFDVEYTNEDCLKLLNQIVDANVLPPSITDQLKQFTKDQENKLPTSSVCDNKQLNDNNNRNNSTTEKLKAISNLFNEEKKDESKGDRKTMTIKKLISLDDYKVPNIVWQQSESMIYLSISAPDIEDYYLYVEPECLIFISYRENEKNAVVINFLGIVCPQLTSHGIKGLNVVVRLVKALKNVAWPRLTWTSNKCSWLKYNYDAIAVDDNKETTQLDCNYSNGNMHPNSEDDFYDSEKDNDDDNYDIDIDHINDNFDPLVSDF